MDRLKNPREPFSLVYSTLFLKRLKDIMHGFLAVDAFLEQSLSAWQLRKCCLRIVLGLLPSRTSGHCLDNTIRHVKSPCLSHKPTESKVR